MKKFNEALDEIRRDETRELRAAGYEPVLRKARRCLLKRPENLTDRQTTSLREILKHNLKTVRAWLSREDFQRFWEYSSPAWAGKVLDEWTDRTMRTRLQPLMLVAEMLRRHKLLLLNWFRARGEFSAGCVEGMNGKAKLTMKKAYGFKSFNVAEVALLHTLGKLPTPEVTHTFWWRGKTLRSAPRKILTHRLITGKTPRTEFCVEPFFVALIERATLFSPSERAGQFTGNRTPQPL